jgi:NADH:ubiquinone oxidoreductase subunit 3 (subunit A)
MLGVAVVLIVLGIIGLFLFPWGGIVVGAVGVVLLIAFLLGFGRRAQAAESTRP